jgi:hypothetical protein
LYWYQLNEMNGEKRKFLKVSELNRSYDEQNRRNIVASGLNIRTSADIFEEAQKKYEEAEIQKFARKQESRAHALFSQASQTQVFGYQKKERVPGSDLSRNYDEQNRRNIAASGLDMRTSADIFEEADRVYGEERAESVRRAGVSRGVRRATSGVRKSSDRLQGNDSLRVSEQLQTDDEPPRKRARMSIRRGRSEEQQVEDVASVLQKLKEEFSEKERLSHERTWCAPIPHSRKVSTVQEFYKAFHDKGTLPIHTCMVCYRKFGSTELEEFDWYRWNGNSKWSGGDSPFKCGRCFPVGQKTSACADCLKHLVRGVLSPPAYLHSLLGCEHLFPEELKGLTPVEEKLIALNSSYGFITRHSIEAGRKRSTSYPKHVKGHITVFPNNVQDLATRVLPHPLLKVMDDIHVSWHGPEKPAPRDLSVLLSVRRHVVERALLWLKRHNPLYFDVDIDVAEMNSWDGPSHGVPSQVYDRLERNEPSVREKIQTAHIVPPEERGLGDHGPVDIEELLASLQNEHDVQGEAVLDGLGNDTEVDESRDDTVHEVNSSGMFNVDDQVDIADTERLKYLFEVMGENVPWGGSAFVGSAEVCRGSNAEPYILVKRGDEFADSFEPLFFAKTFPTLLPFGKGGPRLAEENGKEDSGHMQADSQMASHASTLTSSRNMGLSKWTKVVLQRHGGRFARHPVFAFLVFNIGVRSRNHHASMASVRKKEFSEVESMVRSLTAERLENAKIELEATGKSNDMGINRLLRSLSLYGYRQPMSRENRMTMRRKIKSLIIRHGIPAIWFTLSPNDITNPVKLRLAAYRIHSAEEAEAFIASLDKADKKFWFSLSDSLSSAILFHREISMFFKHYVKVGEDSVFGRISQYFAAVETNERGALHVHGLLWLQGNMQLNSLLTDVLKEDQSTYRDQVIEYVDSVFTEVRTVDGYC